MANLIYRLTSDTPVRSASTVKNLPLSNVEIDGNFKVIDNDLNTKAPLASPALTGIPTAPTAAAGTNNTQVATTAHVFAERSNVATLTNKTISADNNSISGIAASSFVVTDGTGAIDGAAAQKAIPAGVVVGTTDTQTLTNKTLNNPNIFGPVFTKQGGQEGGEVWFEIGDTGTTLSTRVIVDVNGNNFRIFEGGGTGRGAFLNLANGGAAASHEIITNNASQTLINKTINGSSNTLSNIANASLVNSSVTINGTAISLGSSVTIAAANPSAVTFNNGGSGSASGTTFNGSSAITVSYNTIGAPSATGANASGTWGISITGNAATASNITATSPQIGISGSGLNIDTTGQGGPQIQGQGGGAAMMSFHRPGAYAINFGLGTDNQLRTGGWSRGGNFVILDSGNYNSYAPTLTGTGASGTWGINITGNATTSTTANALNNSNNYRINSLGVGTDSSGTSGEIRATNNITAYYSDDRLKTRLGLIENALDKVCSLTGFYYQANETAQELGYEVIREVGLSAQDVQNVLPEVVVPAPIDDKYLTVRYDKLIPLLVEAIKEIKKEINSLKG